MVHRMVQIDDGGSKVENLGAIKRICTVVA